MIELAEIFRRYGPADRAKFADRMLPSHVAAMDAIEPCRTAALGGQLYQCADCGELE
jgi:Transposase zinc-binding domain